MTMTLFQGEICGHIGSIIFGWAWCPTDPQRRVHVEILLDNQSIGCVTAQLYNAELKDNHIGDGFYAFTYMLPEFALKHTRLIQARVANHNQRLDGQISLVNDNDALDKNLPLDAMLYHDGGLTLHGWVRDPFNPAKIFTLECIYKGKTIIQVQTNIIREQPGQFKIILPAYLADGHIHEIKVQTQDDIKLPGSPLKVFAQPQGALPLLDTLLPGDKNKNSHSAVQSYELLKVLMQNYEQRLPNSICITEYDKWYSLYENSLDSVPENTAHAFILIIVTLTEGNVSKTLHSLLKQTHPNWLAWVEGTVPEAFKDEQRIQKRPAESVLDTVLTSKSNCLTFIDSGDHLPDYAFTQVLDVFITHKNTGLVYTDCDHDDHHGKRTNPWFKPAWDPDLFLSQNYIHHLCVINADLLKQLPSNLHQLPWLAVQAAEQRQQKIVHLPHILYHRRHQARESVKNMTMSLTWAQQYLHTVEPAATITALPEHAWLRKVVRPVPDKQPLISLIIPSKDQAQLLKACIESIEQRSTYRHFEIIIVDNQTSDKDALALLNELQQRGHKIIRYDKTFNYAAINNFAVEHALGEIIGLINNDIEVITARWMEEMLSLLLRPGVGAVGAKLLWPNEMVQHGGVLLGVNNLAAHIGNENMSSHLGYHGQLQVTHRVGAVTAACLLTRKSDYLRCQGLDENAFPVAFNDVDYCLKLSQHNLASVWTPFACLTHAESTSRGKDDIPQKAARAQMEMTNLRQRWTEVLMADRYYHPSLSLNSANAPFSALAIPPRNRSPRL